jgi:hypothetical protein
MEIKRFAPTIGLGILLLATGFFVVARAWESLRFWIWRYSNRVPCPLFPLEYQLLGTTLSTTNYSTTQVIFNLGSDITALGFALIILTINKIQQANSN